MDRESFQIGNIENCIARSIGDPDFLIVQAAFERDPAFFELIQGAPPGPGEVQSLVTALPAGKDYDDKFVGCIYEVSGSLYGVYDIIRNHPADGIWCIGLLYLVPECRGKGLGRSIVASIEAEVSRHHGHAVQIVVARENHRARRFWDQRGYRYVREKEMHHGPSFRSMVDELERRL